MMESWPEPLRKSFEAYLEKFWVVGRQHYEYVDNHREARVDNADEMLRYEDIRSHGCCGSYDRTIELDGVKITFGFNHGH
jgi:hypothetical protein